MDYLNNTNFTKNKYGTDFAKEKNKSQVEL